MSKFKKVLSMILVVAVVAGIAISGTMAYLTSTDSDVNVMTLGNVKIAQHEYQRVTDEEGEYKIGTIDKIDSYVLEAFEQAKPLYPIVGDPSKPGDDPGYAGYDSIPVRMSQVDSYGGMDVFAGKNAQDKFVTVENTGKTDAYVRTLVAIEVGDADPDLIGSSYHIAWTATYIGTIEIDGNKYALTEYVYSGAQLSDGSYRHENGVLPAGDTSYPNLSQVYLKSEATNEDMEKIDGNNNGTLDILVLSQAVQAEGFADAATALDTAFGEVNTANAPAWFGSASIPATVSTAADLENALADGDVILADDLTFSANATSANSGYAATGISVKGSTFDGAGNTLTVTDANTTWAAAIHTTGGSIKNVTISGAMRGIFMTGAIEDLYIDNVSFDTIYTFNSDGGNKEYGVYISNSTMNGWTSYSNVHKEVVFTNCTFTEGNGYAFLRAYNSTEFKDCYFDETAGFELQVKSGATATFENCYYGDTLITAENIETLGLLYDTDAALVSVK